MKTAISVPDSLFERAERVAAASGSSRSGLYARALAAYLDQVEQTGSARRFGLWAGQVHIAEGVDLIASDPEVVALFEA